MIKFWSLIYNTIALPLLYALLHIAKYFNPKIKYGINDRKRLFEDLILQLLEIDRKKKLIWFHSSSMGEFEQAKPVIQKLKEQKNVNVLATFFSPSGYKNNKNYAFSDLISYIPFDSKVSVNRFLDIVQPDLAIMIRYDIWPNFIWNLKKRNIPTFIIDATMRKNSVRKALFIKNFHKNVYENFTEILTVSENDLTSFKDFNIPDSALKAIGDTRFDRVYQKSLEAKNKKLFKEGFLKGKKILVAGSSWDEDEEVILPAFLKLAKYDKNIILILVPHEPTIQHLEKLEAELSGKIKTIRFSYLNSYKDERIIIIDSIGILLTLYYYADAAYVGGSFKQGIHNVLEPAVYGIPVLFGPKIENSQEAKKLVEIGAAKVIRNKKEAYRMFRTLFNNEDLRCSMGNISSEYVNSNIGATDRILTEICKYV